MKLRQSSGFSLVELLVVVVIIVILAGMITPIISRASSRASQQDCYVKARQIAMAINTYATSHKGWTPFNPDHYVKLAGFKSSSDVGYKGEAAGTWASNTGSQSYSHAQTIRNFVCPIDDEPTPTTYAVPSSYQVLQAATNLNDLEDRSSSLLIREYGERHKDDDGVPTYHLAFADMHAELATKREYIPGLAARWWQSSSIWSNVQTDTVSATPDYSSVWVKQLAESRFDFLPQTGDWIVDSPDKPDTITLRLDGYIVFPESGDWRILTMSLDDSYVWVDLNDNGVRDSGEYAEKGGSSIAEVESYSGIQAGKKYRFAVAWMEDAAKQYLNLFWSTDPSSVVDSRTKRSIIPASALFFKAAQLYTE